MQDRVKKVEDFFREYVFGFMYHDIDAAICGKANFLAALGLLEYTEFMGKLLKGGSGSPRNRFDAFLSRLGPEYSKVMDQVKVYHIFRCGLAHEYFIKGPSSISMYNRPPQPCGIVYISGRWVFIVEKYYEDFKASVGKYYNELLSGDDGKLVEGFLSVVRHQGR